MGEGGNLEVRPAGEDFYGDIGKNLPEDLREAESRGKAEGEDKLLIGQICRKLLKGKDIDIIIDEVESEDDERIQTMIDIAEKYAPDYEAEKVFEEYIKTVKERIPEIY